MFAAAAADGGALKEIWRANEPLPNSEQQYGFTQLAMTLNEEDETVTCPTDSRRRPDQRLLEESDVDAASSEKFRLEEKQRVARRAREACKEKWKPRYRCPPLPLPVRGSHAVCVCAGGLTRTTIVTQTQPTTLTTGSTGRPSCKVIGHNVPTYFNSCVDPLYLFVFTWLYLSLHIHVCAWSRNYGYLLLYMSCMSVERNLIKTPDYVVRGFRPETDFTKTVHHRKGHVKSSRMVQISSSYNYSTF